ncbi:MAG: DUF2805 domain-containing protein [Deltaproteobacteria bacterium]|jgi:uncharacterized protein (TIGR03643 family)|nr:DUF2805 domain-containing protein [Deltaproteobacteria bacterium]MBT6491499.1 DUF2805 domain-containing protein [Deltaproteobacteria bacterium]
MRKNSDRPLTRVKKTEPAAGTDAWIVWAAWADRITFEEIREKTQLTENEVIRRMRRLVSPRDFRRWRKRANTVSHKHRKRFTSKRRLESEFE